MPITAPSAAPEEAPRISGETSGLRNRPWKAQPAMASADPHRIAATMRGPDVPDHGLNLGRQAGGLARDQRPEEAAEIAGRDRKAPEREGGEHGERQQEKGDQVAAQGGGHRINGVSPAK